MNTHDATEAAYKRGYIDGYMDGRRTEWISCEERLPTENGKYLIIRESSLWEIRSRWIALEYYSTEFKGWFVDGAKLFDVTHWMPLPDAPKGVE